MPEAKFREKDLVWTRGRVRLSHCQVDNSGLGAQSCRILDNLPGGSGLCTVGVFLYAIPALALQAKASKMQLPRLKYRFARCRL